VKLPASLVPQFGVFPQASTQPLANMAAGQSDRLTQPIQPMQPKRPRPPRPGGSLASMAAGPRVTSTF